MLCKRFIDICQELKFNSIVFKQLYAGVYGNIPMRIIEHISIKMANEMLMKTALFFPSI